MLLFAGFDVFQGADVRLVWIKRDEERREGGGRKGKKEKEAGRKVMYWREGREGEEG